MMMMTGMTVRRPLRKMLDLLELQLPVPASKEAVSPSPLFCSVLYVVVGQTHHSYTAGHGCATTYQGMDNAEGDCSQHQLHGGDHQQAAQHHCQYRTHEEDRQPGQGLC